jgi:hypothetical protein
MDFYRLFTGKSIKVGAIIACLMCLGSMLASFGIVELCKLAAGQDMNAIMSLSLFITQVEWAFGVDFADIVLTGTGAFSLFIGCMISASFIGSEQSCGFTKNFAGQLPNKGYMAISKFIVTSAAQFLILFIYTAVSSICAVLLFGKYITGYEIGGLMLALGLRVLLYFAVNAIIVFLCTLTKSHAVAMVAGCIFGSGITKFAYLIAGMVLSTMKINITISDYMPDGINSLLSMSTLDDLAVKGLVVAVVFITVFLGANYLVVRKRDVR